ncbi:Bug family tripartite tricarboxylate transporter substrate binding protein [Pelagibacterium lacus]|uniref:Tripartite tricarboxylate transporter substrate binding protein n=1 Tax=Pelagibacterium lacus TaxID=2282655 RepID=A0A369W3C5_9HYPH|nr:tripartite tricarboxylate transporter substrate-binding protein [Pelagibacterium lacus]RDE09038.1 hypothetical protein DVH29_08775 [Pelagibacterium lacus]
MFSDTALSWIAGGAVVLGALGATQPAFAQEDFYAGKTIELIIGFAPGGGNDLLSRVVASHLGDHIPGNPAIIPVNLPGAGGLTAANQLYNSSPQDGTVIGIVSQAVPLQSKMIDNVEFEMSGFNFIGRVQPSASVTMVWHTSDVMDIEQAMEEEVILSATNIGSSVSLYPRAMNEFLGTKFNLIMGYEGSAAAMLAMERGEVEGHSTTFEALMAANPRWFEEGQVRILVQHGLDRDPALPDIPTSVELAPEENRAVMELIMSSNDIGKYYFTTPGVPEDRLEILRRAFDSMVEDPDFLRDAEAIGATVNPMSGEDLQAMIARFDSIDPALLQQASALYEE